MIYKSKKVQFCNQCVTRGFVFREVFLQVVMENSLEVHAGNGGEGRPGNNFNRK